MGPGNGGPDEQDSLEGERSAQESWSASRSLAVLLAASVHAIRIVAELSQLEIVAEFLLLRRCCSAGGDFGVVGQTQGYSTLAFALPFSRAVPHVSSTLSFLLSGGS